MEQQAALGLHRTRELLVKERTQLVNMIRTTVRAASLFLLPAIVYGRAGG